MANHFFSFTMHSLSGTPIDKWSDDTTLLDIPDDVDFEGMAE